MRKYPKYVYETLQNHIKVSQNDMILDEEFDNDNKWDRDKIFAILCEQYGHGSDWVRMIVKDIYGIQLPFGKKQAGDISTGSDTPESVDKFLSYLKKEKTFQSGSFAFCYKYDDKKDTYYIQMADTKANKTWCLSGTNELRDVIYKEDLPLRICDACGKPMEEGFTDEEGMTYFCSQVEFTADMDARYGKGNWRPEPTGDYDYCYEFRENENSPWESEPSFWTQWE